MSAVETSIIIRTYNEQAHLPGLFDALDTQTYRDFESIVVDSGSTDRSRHIASARADRLIPIDSADFTFGYSLNIGIAAGSGRFLVLVSAHTIPIGPGWLGALIEPLRCQHTAMSYGRQLGGPTSRFSEVMDLRRTFGSERLELRPPHFFANNANAAVRADLWREHHFDEFLTGLEDIAWAKHWMEQGYRVVYEPAAALHHIHEESWPQVRRRYYREALAARRIGTRTPRAIPGMIARECVWSVSDIARAVLSPPPEAGSVPLAKRLSEIALFRVNKALGTLRGLTDVTAITDTAAAHRTLYFDKTNRSVVIDGPGRARLEQLDLPLVKPGEVLIRVAYVGVCATDLEILDGALGYYNNGMAEYPIVPGHEFSGRIAAVGQNERVLSVGDPVVVECIQSCGKCSECQRGNEIGCPDRAEVGVLRRNGGYAEYVVVPGRFVHRIDNGLDLRTAALCEPVAVVEKALRRLGAAWGNGEGARRCAVVGAGSIGHICARVLASRGHTVTVFDRDQRRLSYFEGSPIATSADMAALKDFDTAIEATGHPEALDDILHRTPAGATILLVGLPYARQPFSFETLVAFDKTVVGSVGSRQRDFASAIRIMPQLGLDEYLRCVLPLHRFQEAWTLARSRQHLKVLLEVHGDAT